MVRVLIYTKRGCPFCHAAKDLLDHLKINYHEIVILNDDDILNKLNKELNHYTLPKIFINEKFIGGFDNLKALYNSGELINILK